MIVNRQTLAESRECTDNGSWFEIAVPIDRHNKFSDIIGLDTAKVSVSFLLAENEKIRNYAFIAADNVIIQALFSQLM